MRFNPFGFLIETKTYPLARLQRSSFWGRMKDTIHVFYGEPTFHVKYGRYGDSRFGIFDYLTLGIPWCLHYFSEITFWPFQWGFIPVGSPSSDEQYFHQYLPALIRLPLEILRRVFAIVSLIPMIFLQLACNSFIFVIGAVHVSMLLISFLISFCLRGGVSIALTALVLPLIALAHIYFSMQGQGKELNRIVFNSGNHQQPSGDNIQSDAFSNIDYSAHYGTGFYREGDRRMKIFYNGLYYNTKIEECEPYLRHLRDLNLPRRPEQVLGCLAKSNNPITFFPRKKDTREVLKIQIFPDDKRLLSWLKAVLALNLFGLAEWLEEQYRPQEVKALSTFRPAYASVSTESNESENLDRSGLTFFTMLIECMEKFDLSTIVPSQSVPEDAFMNHVAPFL